MPVTDTGKVLGSGTIKTNGALSHGDPVLLVKFSLRSFLVGLLLPYGVGRVRGRVSGTPGSLYLRAGVVWGR